MNSDREYKKGTPKKGHRRKQSTPKKLWTSDIWNPIQTWRDQEEEEREEQQRFGVTSLAYCPNRMESKKLRREENE